MVDTFLFNNCRGVNYGCQNLSKWIDNEWTSPAFNPNPVHENFWGSRARANHWFHFNEEEIDNNLASFKSIGINLVRVFPSWMCWDYSVNTEISAGVWGAKNRALDDPHRYDYIEVVQKFCRLCEKHRIRILWQIFGGGVRPPEKWPQASSVWEDDYRPSFLGNTIGISGTGGDESQGILHPDNIFVCSVDIAGGATANVWDGIVTPYLDDFIAAVSGSRATFGYDIVNEPEAPYVQGEWNFPEVSAFCLSAAEYLSSLEFEHPRFFGCAELHPKDYYDLHPIPEKNTREMLESPFVNALSTHDYNLNRFAHKWKSEWYASATEDFGKPFIVGETGIPVAGAWYRDQCGPIQQEFGGGRIIWEGMIAPTFFISLQGLGTGHGLFHPDGEVRDPYDVSSFLDWAVSSFPEKYKNYRNLTRTFNWKEESEDVFDPTYTKYSNIHPRAGDIGFYYNHAIFAGHYLSENDGLRWPTFEACMFHDNNYQQMFLLDETFEEHFSKRMTLEYAASAISPTFASALYTGEEDRLGAWRADYNTVSDLNRGTSGTPLAKHYLSEELQFELSAAKIMFNEGEDPGPLSGNPVDWAKYDAAFHANYSVMSRCLQYMIDNGNETKRYSRDKLISHNDPRIRADIDRIITHILDGYKSGELG